MFAYCNNNPANYTDSAGCFAISIAVIIGSIVSSVIGTGFLFAEIDRITSLSTQADALVAQILSEAQEANNNSDNSQGAEVSAAAAPASPEPPNSNNNDRNNRNERDFVKARSNKVANKWAQRAGWDSAEAFKRDFVGNQGPRFDMYYDRANDVLILIEKATGLIVETDVTFLR